MYGWLEPSGRLGLGYHSLTARSTQFGIISRRWKTVPGPMSLRRQDCFFARYAGDANPSMSLFFTLTLVSPWSGAKEMPKPWERVCLTQWGTTVDIMLPAYPLPAADRCELHGVKATILEEIIKKVFTLQKCGTIHAKPQHRVRGELQQHTECLSRQMDCIQELHVRGTHVSRHSTMERESATVRWGRTCGKKDTLWQGSSTVLRFPLGHLQPMPLTCVIQQQPETLLFCSLQCMSY